MTLPKKFLLRESNQTVDVVMLPKFGNSSVLTREVFWLQTKVIGKNYVKINPEDDKKTKKLDKPK